MRTSKRVIPALLVAGLLSAPVILRAAGDDEGYKSGQATKSAKKDAKAAEKMSNAEEVLKAAAGTDADKGGIPHDLLDKAKCVGVFPGFKKVALGVGGEGGKGVFTCRTDHGMSGPAFFKIGGGSVGWQAGVKEADLVLLVMNEDAMNKLLAGKVEIGTDISAVAGPVGAKAGKSDTSDHDTSDRDDHVNKDALKTADILAWSRARGGFAGASLDGLSLAQDEDDNQQLYKKPVQAKEILTSDQDTLPVPQLAQSFVKTTEDVM